MSTQESLSLCESRLPTGSVSSCSPWFSVPATLTRTITPPTQQPARAAVWGAWTKVEEPGLLQTEIQGRVLAQ